MTVLTSGWSPNHLKSWRLKRVHFDLPGSGRSVTAVESGQPAFVKETPCHSRSATT